MTRKNPAGTNYKRRKLKGRWYLHVHSGFSRKTEPQGICRHARGDLIWGLALVIMGAEKFFNLPSVNKRPRKGDGIIWSESEGLRPWGPVV